MSGAAPAGSDPVPTDAVPTDPEQADAVPTDPEQADPVPTDAVPTDPEPTHPEPTHPEPTHPEPTHPEQADREQSDVGATSAHAAVASDVLELRRAGADDARAVAEVWIASFSDALPSVRRAHDDAEVRGWVAAHLVPATECWVATLGGEVVAMMALSPGWLDQLYVVPGAQGHGIGSALVDLALRRGEEEGWETVQLWTFQVNGPARAFYARHGFREVELTDGATNEEHEPDVRLIWP